MRGKIVLHQHLCEFIGLAVIVTGNNDIRCFVLLREQVILKMRIAHYLRREFLPFRMIVHPDLLSQGLFMGKIPVVVCSDCHVQRTPLFTVYCGAVCDRIALYRITLAFFAYENNVFGKRRLYILYTEDIHPSGSIG